MSTVGFLIPFLASGAGGLLAARYGTQRNKGKAGWGFLWGVGGGLLGGMLGSGIAKAANLGQPSGVGQYLRDNGVNGYILDDRQSGVGGCGGCM